MLNVIYFKLKSLKNIILKYFLSSPFYCLLALFFYLTAIVVVYLSIWGGLKFITGLGALGSIIIKRLIFLMFFILFFMMSVSFSVIYYTSSFRSKETSFLLTLPYLYKEVSFLKFMESAFFTGWIPLGGLILFIVAYTNINGLSAVIPLLSIFYLIPFILIASSLGYLLCIFALKFFSLKKAFVISVLFVVISIFVWHPLKTTHTNIFYFLSEEILFFKISQLWFIPFSWPAWIIIDLENGKFVNGFIFLLNLWALTILIMNSIYFYGGNIFKQLFLKYSVPAHKRLYREGLLDKLLSLKILPHNITNFIIKDIKLFVREPTLWLQFLIFFGLMFFYFINIKRFSYNLLSDVWKNLIVFLNTFSVLCISSALSIRFVFPQWSLEGKSYWILKLSPVSTKSIHLEKFILSSVILLPISILLIYISNRMLEINSELFLLTIWIVLISTASLICFSLGLGAYFADFKMASYLKAVESFGGFVALIINFSYVVITIFGFTILNHLFIVKDIMSFKKYIVYILGLWSIASIMLSLTITYAGIRKLESKNY